MPNGFHASEHEVWERLEAPLRRLDGEIDAFAGRNAMSVVRNYHNWPHRSLQWTDDLKRAIEITLTTDAALAENPPGRDRSARSAFGAELLGATPRDAAQVVPPTYSVSGVAWTLDESERRWHTETVIDAQPIAKLELAFGELLERTRVTVASWTAGDLRRASSA
ncbi:MAG: hypothetical protein ACR2OD_02380 [Gaiellaceae bacterium]